MIIPKCLKAGDTIAIASPFNGIVKGSKIRDLDEIIKWFQNKKLKIIEDKYTRKSVKGASSLASARAKELTKLIENKQIKLIVGVTGGDYLIELLDEVDLDCIIDNYKWVQGQSDMTILLYILTTKYNVMTIYFYNAASLKKASIEELSNNYKILSGNKIIQKDFKYKINELGEKESSCWLSNCNINVTGIIIGGSLECLIDLLGTKYDCTHKFIEDHKEEGIIWYFDINCISNETIFRCLWHLRNAGWFKYAKCLIFGRTEEKSYTGITLDEVITRGLGKLNIPYIKNFDLGHSTPRIVIVNGSKVNLVCDEINHSIRFI